jgi:archaellum component FlaC
VQVANYADFENASNVQISLHLDWITTDGSFTNTTIQPGEVARVAGFDGNARAYICHRSDGATFKVCPANSRVARAGDYFVLNADGGYEDGSRYRDRSPTLQSLIRVDKNRPRLGWVVVAAEVIYELAYAYQAFKDGGEDSQVLDSINKQLKNIEAKLNTVVARLDDVLATLRALPAAVQQVVDATFVNQTIALVRSSTQQVQSLSDPRYIDQNVQSLERVLSKLQDEINLLAGVKQDAARAMLAISAYSVYLSGKVALEREKKRQSPDTYNIQSPWGESLNEFVKAQFDDLLRRADAQQQFYDENCKMPPANGTYLQIGGRYFVPRTVSVDTGIVLPRAGDYQILKSVSVPGEVVDYWFGVYRYRRPTDGVVFDPDWFDVSEPFQSDESEARRRFRLIFSDQEEIGLFTEFFEKITKGRAGILSCFDEPPLVWR